MESKLKRKTSQMGQKGQLTYFMFENEGKDTLLMLHPAFADHTIFENQLAYFKNNYQIIVIDLPGHGNRNNHIGVSKMTIKDMPEAISQILSENNLDACHVLGVSMGSLVAQAFADRCPHQVKSVIIVGGYSIHKANEQVLRRQKTEGLKWMLYLLFSMKRFRNHVTSVSCFTAAGRESFARGAQHFNRSSFTAMAGMNTFFIRKDTPMPYPLLIIVGEYDLQIIKEAAIELQKLEKEVQLVFLEEAGHCANADAPNTFNRLLERFLLEI
ncbi:alpha/beta hydrolase [Paenibacillus sp. LHD-38]|uniref:alpha/beta fold hydrolase n=1 Tax=Paenibacillus sp. LHD-38 TaxID=3072143 RepID=UPI0028100B26|nr:alpha/beta hydrolase [Paenibacillus sp. LHD-38]MDQ8738107.1 alpha/beta hydrolase [Paenibacillus sp. LHD-38]